MEVITLPAFGEKWAEALYGVIPGQRGYAKQAIDVVSVVTGQTVSYSRSLYYGQFPTPESTLRLLAIADMLLEVMRKTNTLDSETFLRTFTISV
jgi:hypothetical protein